jgi:hypothetical protein
MIQTNDPAIVRSARSFVRGLCLNELSPGILDRLSKIYRPPRNVVGVRTQSRKKNRKFTPILPRVHLAQLRLMELPEGSEVVEEKGRRVARKRRKYGRGYIVDDFSWTGKCESIQEGDKVIQVIKDDHGTRFVIAPGDVLHRRAWRRMNRPTITFFYVERPDKRRVRLEKLTRRLGYGAKKRLKRGGIVGGEFAERLLAIWS